MGQNLLLMEKVTKFLAGRPGMLYLFPLSRQEAESERMPEPPHLGVRPDFGTYCARGHRQASALSHFLVHAL